MGRTRCECYSPREEPRARRSPQCHANGALRERASGWRIAGAAPRAGPRGCHAQPRDRSSDCRNCTATAARTVSLPPAAHGIVGRDSVAEGSPAAASRQRLSAREQAPVDLEASGRDSHRVARHVSHELADERCCSGTASSWQISARPRESGDVGRKTGQDDRPALGHRSRMRINDRIQPDRRLPVSGAGTTCRQSCLTSRQTGARTRCRARRGEKLSPNYTTSPKTRKPGTTEVVAGLPVAPPGIEPGLS